MNDMVDKVAPNWAVKPETLEAVNQSLRVDNRVLRRILAYAKDLHEDRERAYADLQESKAELAGELAEAHARVGELEKELEVRRVVEDSVVDDDSKPVAAKETP